MHADTVFLNGPVLTVDEAAPLAEAVAINGDRISAVGSHDDIKAVIGPSTRTIDLGGRALLPGINDNHTHPMAYGQALGQIDATPGAAPTLAAIRAAFRAAASIDSDRQDGWLIARGYDDTRLDFHRHPTRQELDAATGARPALLVRTCGHLAVANTAALDLAGLGPASPDPDGGQIDRDPDGAPTGLLRETAMGLVRRLIPPPTESEIKAHILAAGTRFLAYGITSVGEAAIRSSAEFAAYESLAAG